MDKLTPLDSLKFFKKNIPVFLSTDTETETLIEELVELLQDKPQGVHAQLLSCGKKFIKRIISKSIECLSNESDSPQKSSKEAVLKYIDTFTVFEDMLLGLDENYRDHTLHSLWVYLFGHEFISRLGGYDGINIAGQMRIAYQKENFILVTEDQVGTRTHMEAMWGMISILHDLGYPIENMMRTPNDVFRDILEPFAIDFNSVFQIDVGSRITLLHQSICDLLSTMYRPEAITHNEAKNFSEKARKERKEQVISRRPTTSKDEGIEMEFKIASVNKAHSAWSSILAFKNIAYLHEGNYKGGGIRDYLKLLTQKDILYSILHHTSEQPKDEAVNRFQFVLLLIDDIEETMRYSRGGKSRGLKSEYCEVEWDVNKDKTTIKLDYSKHEELDAQSKYSQMENKYKIQKSKSRRDSRYVIELKFLHERTGFYQDMQLMLFKDSAPIPSKAIPDNDI